MPAMRKITLSYPWYGAQNKTNYKVEKISNSVAYHPAAIINEAEVERLCRDPKWDVTIVSSTKQK